MKNQFRSTKDFRSNTPIPVCETDAAPFSYTADDITRGERLKGLRRRKRVRVFLLLIPALLLVIIAALFAVLMMDGVNDVRFNGFLLELEDSGTLTTEAVDTAAFLAVADGDYSAFEGFSLRSMVSLTPSYAGCKFLTNNAEVAAIVDGVLYGIRPGIAVVTAVTADGTVLGSFDFCVTDTAGAVDYKVTFQFPSDGNTVFTVWSGRSMRECGFTLPALPQLPGYVARAWTVNGQDMTDTRIITSDTTVQPDWTTGNLLFNKTQFAHEGTYGDTYFLDLSKQILEGSGNYTFVGTNLLDGLSLTPEGLLSGYLGDVRTDATGTPLPYSFYATATDNANGTSATLSFSFTVQKKETAVTFFNTVGLVYDGTVRTASVNINGIISADIGNLEAVTTYNGNPTFKNAGAYIAEVAGLAGAKSDCYILTGTRTKVIQVLPILAEITFSSTNDNPSNLDYVYNGTVRELSAAVSNALPGETVEAYLSYSEPDSTRIYAQDEAYTATVLALSNPNYALPEEGVSASFRILKAPATATLLGGTKVYGEGDDNAYYTFSLQGILAENAALVEVVLHYGISRTPGETVAFYSIALSTGTANSALDLHESPEMMRRIYRSYDITGITAPDAVLEITPRPVALYNPEGELFIHKVFNANTAVILPETIAPAPAEASSASGLLAGDEVLVAHGYYAQIAPGTDIGVTFYLGGADANNYTITGQYTGSIAHFTVRKVEGLTVQDKTVSDGDLTATVDVTNAYVLLDNGVQYTLEFDLFEASFLSAAPGDAVPVHITAAALTVLLQNLFVLDIDNELQGLTGKIIM